MVQGVVQRGHNTPLGIAGVVGQRSIAEFLTMAGGQPDLCERLQVPADHVDHVVAAQLACRLIGKPVGYPVDGVVHLQHGWQGRGLQAAHGRSHRVHGYAGHQDGAERQEQPDHGMIMPVGGGAR